MTAGLVKKSEQTGSMLLKGLAARKKRARDGRIGNHFPFHSSNAE